MISFPALPEYSAVAAHIMWEPVMGSGERITAAVALQNAKDVRVVSLLSPEILAVLYRDKGANASSLIGMITDSIKSHLKRGGTISDWVSPLSGFFAVNVREYLGQSPEDVIDQVAGLHSSLYKARAPQKEERLPTHNDGEIREKVKTAAKKIAGIKADRIFTPDGIIEVKESGRMHYLNIPVKTEAKVGSIMSAWYQTPATIETHFLRAMSDLNVAAERDKYERGLFISLPSALVGHKNQMQVENLIDDIYWRLSKVGCYLEVRETPEALAEEILAWAS